MSNENRQKRTSAKIAPNWTAFPALRKKSLILFGVVKTKLRVPHIGFPEIPAFANYVPIFFFLARWYIGLGVCVFQFGVLKQPLKYG